MVSVSKPKHQSVISRIPISNILIETDSPSQVVKEMIPELSAEDKPSNHPKYLPYVLDKLSLIKGISQENLIEELRDNYERIINS